MGIRKDLYDVGLSSLQVCRSVSGSLVLVTDGFPFFFFLLWMGRKGTCCKMCELAGGGEAAGNERLGAV